MEQLQQHALESYQPSVDSLDCIQSRTQYQTPEYVRLHQKLSGASGEELCCQVGYRPSASQTSNTPNQATSASTSSLTRSRYHQFQSEQCFYCQKVKMCGGKTEHLVAYRSSNVGVSIRDIVDVSGSER